tara:strand:- start:338 stop:607 length:270 start_codon:yes stop_codon:yes gene_type:complete
MSKPTISNFNCHIIGSWQYNIINTECSYCKFSLNQSSPEYYEKGLDSKVIVNCCGHGFHTECINKWLKKSNKCPMCLQEWKENSNTTFV